ncbi:MAG: SemiSWEET family transporter [Thermoplasmata archaeon]
MPQFIKIIMDKSAKEISFLMYIVISIGIFLWFLYGLMINSLPIIVANGVSFILTILILLGKIRYDSHYHLFCNK